MRTLDKIATSLFVIALVLLPAAEWRSIVLPISGKSLGFDPSGQASASPFDLIFLLFCMAIIPTGLRFIRERRFLSPWLVHWTAALVLFGLLLATNEHALPFLTPAARKVVDARSLLLHIAVMVAVAIYLSSMKLETIVRGTFAFSAASTAGLAILSTLALVEFPYFRSHYPFTNPTHVVFPFPTYNVTAIFVTVTGIGLVCSAYCLRKPLAIVLGVPVLLLAAGLTGSRSNLFVFVAMLTVLAAVALLAALRRQTGSSGLRRAAWMSAGTMSLAAAALVGGYDWQPIRRALSIFGEVVSDPVVLLTGQPGSPRNELWRLALSRADISGLLNNQNYSVILTSIHDGCVTISEPLHGLEPNHDYWVRLRHDSSSSEAMLEVFTDPARTESVGATSLARAKARLPWFSMYLADSVVYVNQSGTVREFSLEVDGERVTDDASKIISYFDPLNGAPGVPVGLRGGELVISAKDRKIRGFVSLAREVPEPKRELALEYRLSLQHVTYSFPIDAPAMFYVGLHDTNPSLTGSEWRYVRNALLIQHRRMSAGWEDYFLASIDAERILAEFPNHTASERRAEYERLQRERRCGASGAHRVADIWRAGKPFDASILGFENSYGGNIGSSSPASQLKLDQSEGRKLISVLSDNVTWSPAWQLKNGGSTHNVYLDWYYYEGAAALAIFLAFALSLITATIMLAWRARRTFGGPVVFGICLQVITLLLLMYAQPYVWIKFIWVVFGIASALLIHDELSGRSDARAS